jgi:hypothetical protein
MGLIGRLKMVVFLTVGFFIGRLGGCLLMLLCIMRRIVSCPLPPAFSLAFSCALSELFGLGVVDGG